MLRVNIYILEEVDNKIAFLAKSMGIKKAEVVRSALDLGLKSLRPKSVSAQGLLDFVKLTEKIPTKNKLPKDFIKNLDYYTWGGSRRDQ